MNDLRKQRTESRKQRAENRELKTENSSRRGVTLIELLVVISIMMLLAAYALPKLGPMSNDRKIRETARSVNVFLSRARSRALETGRPCGVVFQRLSADVNSPLVNAVGMLYQAEVPPPYAGDTTSARVTMEVYAPGYLARVDTTGAIQQNLLRIGDVIQINGQGPWYTINESNPDTKNIKGEPIPDGIVDGPIVDLRLSVPLKYQDSLPWGAAASAPLPFTIHRLPVRTIAQPLTLPVGATVDLSVSGFDQIQNTDNIGDLDHTFSNGLGDVTIMFSPNGSVGQIYWDSFDQVALYDYDYVPNIAAATDPIFLMIGWRDKVGLPGIANLTQDVDEEELPNWQNMSNLWIVLNSQTGLISSAENAFTTELEPVGALASRQYARQASSKGGR